MTSSDPGDRETYGDYSVDDETQLPASDTLDDEDVADLLDRGYSPPERYSTAQKHGVTPAEEGAGETLEERLAQEEPEPDPYAADESADEAEALSEREVGDERAGRLVEPDQGAGDDVEKELVAEDVGIDGAAASAEEAAVHVLPDEEVLPEE
jgi:hypothetical protein